MFSQVLPVLRRVEKIAKRKHKAEHLPSLKRKKAKKCSRRLSKNRRRRSFYRRRMFLTDSRKSKSKKKLGQNWGIRVPIAKKK